jgi:hypothetical protein
MLGNIASAAVLLASVGALLGRAFTATVVDGDPDAFFIIPTNVPCEEILNSVPIDRGNIHGQVTGIAEPARTDQSTERSNLRPPEISGFSPNNGPPGWRVRIWGRHFKGATQVPPPSRVKGGVRSSEAKAGTCAVEGERGHPEPARLQAEQRKQTNKRKEKA